MKRTMALPLTRENGLEDQNKAGGILSEDLERVAAGRLGGPSERFRVMNLPQRDLAKRGEELTGENYELWRQEQNDTAAKLDKQLQCRRELDELIEEQLSRHHCYYHQATVPTSLKDVSNLLMPEWLPPHELLAVAWLGDWRPTAILDLVRVLAAHHSSFSLSDSRERTLSQIVSEIHVEEAVIDEEYAEIQATCIFHLPFSPLYNVRSEADALSSIQHLFQKIQGVISKAQELRYKVLELVTKKLLNQEETAEFLVAFNGIQEAIHQFAEQQKLRKLSPTVPLKGSGSS